MKKLKYAQGYLGFIKDRIACRSKIYLFLDYDGTLTDIVNDPDDAAPSLRLQNILNNFNNCRFIISIVSGRHLIDLKKILAGLKTGMINLAGSHGSEILIAGSIYSLKPDTEMQSCQNNSIENIKTQIIGMYGKTENITIEQKPGSFAVHYRSLPEAEQSLIKKIIKFLDGQKKVRDFKYMKMKKVIEIMPSHYNKAKTIKRIVNHYERHGKYNDEKWDGLIICIGDDTTDEDLFEENKMGINIKVTDRPDNCVTRAEYYLKNPEDVLLFLEKIL